MFSVFEICIVCVCRKTVLDSLLTFGCGAAKFHAMLVALATHEKGTSMPHKAWHQPFCFRIHLHPITYPFTLKHPVKPLKSMKSCTKSMTLPKWVCTHPDVLGALYFCHGEGRWCGNAYGSAETGVLQNGLSQKQQICWMCCVKLRQETTDRMSKRGWKFSINQMWDLHDIQSSKIKEAFQLQGTGPVVPVHNNVTKRNEGCPRAKWIQWSWRVKIWKASWRVKTTIGIFARNTLDSCSFGGALAFFFEPNKIIYYLVTYTISYCTDTIVWNHVKHT